MNTIQRNWLAFLSPAIFAIGPFIVGSTPENRDWALITYTFIAAGIGGLIAKGTNSAGKKAEDNANLPPATGRKHFGKAHGFEDDV